MFDLGLSPEQFWVITPAQFFALADRKRQDIYREDFRLGVLCSLTANIHRGKNQRAFKPEDFMPRPDVVSSEKEQTPEMLMRKFESIIGPVING